MNFPGLDFFQIQGLSRILEHRGSPEMVCVWRKLLKKALDLHTVPVL